MQGVATLSAADKLDAMCAQIAVRPLEGRCFEHYVEVRDLETHQAVQRFGAVIARLVRQTIGTN